MINIAVDGPSGSGKSTLAKALAKEMKIRYLDTGAMYRAVGYAALCAGIDISDEKQVIQLMENINLRTAYKDDNQIVYVDGVNVMPFIRTPKASKAASDISAYACVRQKLVAMQRQVASKCDIVLDGRDIGTYVLPDAKYKFFITADVEERARRRYKELLQKNIETDFQTVLIDIKRRDAADSGRKLAPLKMANDAILIDTTGIDAEEVLKSVLTKIVRE